MLDDAKLVACLTNAIPHTPSPTKELLERAWKRIESLQTQLFLCQKERLQAGNTIVCKDKQYQLLQEKFEQVCDKRDKYLHLNNLLVAENIELKLRLGDYDRVCCEDQTSVG